MKITIDEEVCKKHNISIEDVVGLLFVKLTNNAYSSLQKLEDDCKIVREDKSAKETNLLITNRWDEEISAVIFESDASIPGIDVCRDLAEKLREIFPKGIKSGSAAWRGNVREITLRLQKFFKLYGSKYSPDEIIEATKKYVASFNGDYTFMRILKYFIMKSEMKKDEDGTGHIEETSDLANFLENDCISDNSDDWLLELR